MSKMNMPPTASPLRRAYANGAHGQIHYYDSGGGDPVLLCLHQSPASSSDYFALMPFLLKAGLRVIAMDTPGMGLSDPPRQEPTLADYADAVPYVLTAAGVGSAHLLGHHTGVQIALETAMRHPDRVHGLSLYGVPLMTAEQRQLLWDQIVPREKAGAIHKPVPDGSNLSDYIARVAKIFNPAGAQRLLLGGLNAGPLWWYAHNAALRHDVTPALLAVRQPMLMISHAGEMMLANTQHAATLRPDAELALLNVDSPMAIDDDPGQLAAAVIEFVKRKAQNS